MTVEMIDDGTVLRVLQSGVALYCIVTGLQALVEFDRYTEEGVLSPEITSLQFEKEWQIRVFDLVFAGRRFEYILYVHIIAGGVLLAQAIVNNISPWSPLLLLVTTVLFGIRHHAGLNGTYHVSLTVLLGILWASITTSTLAVTLAIGFIGVQTVLSYTVAGWLKLAVTDWRNGAILSDLADGEIWVADNAARMLSGPTAVAKLLSWGVIIFECLFPLVLVAPKEIAIGLLAVGTVFHAINAFAMGFNTFLVIYPMTYPAIYYTNRLLHAIFHFQHPL
jgi:hypothetical protein